MPFLKSSSSTENAEAGPSSRPHGSEPNPNLSLQPTLSNTEAMQPGKDEEQNVQDRTRPSRGLKSWLPSFGAARGKAREVGTHVKRGVGESSFAPEESHVGQVSAAKQAAVNQMRARRKAVAWLHTGQNATDDGDDEGNGRESGLPARFIPAERKEDDRYEKGWQGPLTDHQQEEKEEEEEEESAVSTAFLVSYFVAGGAAGATSRTVVSPLERLKIIMQVQPKTAAGGAKAKGAYSGVYSGLKKMWHEEGFKGLMRGNGINCLRIAPYSAVQFSTYEILKNALKDESGELDVPKRLTAGAIAGIASVVSTYPLDLVRSRISIASASLYAEAKKSTEEAIAATKDGQPQQKVRKPTRAEVRQAIEERQKKVPGIWAMTAKVYREEGGFRALYKGCVPTSVGVAPYVAINFAAYEALRKRLANEEGEISTLRKLSCGALAGSISQTLTYPLDVLRRRMQVSGMKNSRLGYSDKSSFAAIRTIVMAEGVFGLYRGITPNLLKVAPSIATSFCCYEFVCNLIHPPHQHAHGNGHSTHH